jgi:cytidyltransferase-like protein
VVCSHFADRQADREDCEVKVLTIGTFDITHFGHYKFLGRCRALAGPTGSLVVGVNTDNFVRTFKGLAPIMTLDERLIALEQSGYTTAQNNSAGRELIEDVKPEVLAVGTDWVRKDYYQQIDVTQDWLDERSIILAYIPYTFAISTSEIKRRVQERG